MIARVVFSAHAQLRAAQFGVDLVDLRDGVLEHHGSRLHNPRSGDWRLELGPVTLIYNHPDGEDATTGRVVTLWRTR